MSGRSRDPSREREKGGLAFCVRCRAGACVGVCWNADSRWCEGVNGEVDLISCLASCLAPCGISGAGFSDTRKLGSGLVVETPYFAQQC